MDSRNKLGQFVKGHEITKIKGNLFCTEGRITKIFLCGKTVLIDPEDLIKIQNYTWNLAYKPNPYAQSTTKNKTIQLARLILNAPAGTIVDHINRNTLDNRKSNLRIVDRSINAINSGVGADNVSGFKGISWDKFRKRYRVYITKNNKTFHIGRFETLESAINARLKAELEYYKI